MNEFEYTCENCKYAKCYDEFGFMLCESGSQNDDGDCPFVIFSDMNCITGLFEQIEEEVK